jgi:hypothetical protein
MISCGRYLLLGVVLGYASLFANSQVTDVAQKIDQRLSAYGPVPVTRVIQVPRKETQCHGGGREGERICGDVTVYEGKPQTTNELMHAANIRIVKSGDLQFGTQTKHELPDHLTVDDFLARNCTPNPASPSFTVSTSFQRTASVAISKSVTHTMTYGMNVSAKLSDVFTVGGNLTIADSGTSGTVNTTGSSSTVTQTRSGTQAVPANTFLVIELRTWPVQYTVPFSTTVTVDADLSANDRGYQHLSDIINEKIRTFTIAGTIEAADASKGDLVFFNIPFDKTKCPTPNAVSTVPHFKTPLGTKLMQMR